MQGDIGVVVGESAGNDRPPHLYHGSPALVAILEPRPARGVGPEQDRLRAVYATHERNFAIPFALPIASDEAGDLLWSLDLEDGTPRIAIVNGYLDARRVGYLYRLPADTFEPLDDLQWVSYTPVAPLDYEIVHPAEYAHWVRRGRGRDRGVEGGPAPYR